MFAPMNTHTQTNIAKLMPLPQNRKKFFGNGDTFFTLDNMKSIVFDTLDETTKIANHLEGNTVSETVSNIKDFLHTQIAYKKDEKDQELYAPARAYQNRFNGIDCKSFSIFAASILTNLGIANSFRQIKQENYNKDYFSHVYVVLPEHNLIIDGTVAYNYEPSYTEKYDLPVLATGLKGLEQLSNTFGLGCCSCNIATRGGGKNAGRGGARLPYASLADILTEQNPKSEQVRNTENVNNSGEQEGNDARLRLAKAKAKARLRKIKLLNL